MPGVREERLSLVGRYLTWTGHSTYGQALPRAVEVVGILLSVASTQHAINGHQFAPWLGQMYVRAIA